MVALEVTVTNPEGCRLGADILAPYPRICGVSVIAK
jgi:hypothetical protein